MNALTEECWRII